MSTRQVIFDFKVPGPEGVIPATSKRIRLWPTRSFEVDESIVLPKPFSHPLVDGKATVTLNVPDGSWIWVVAEDVPGGAREYFTFGEGATPLDYINATYVDPRTLEPGVGPEPAWWVALQQVRDRPVSPAMLQEAVGVVLEEHVESPTPHPAYDEIPNLSLVFENKLI